MNPVILDKNLDRILDKKLDKRLNPREEDISLLPHLLEKTWEEREKRQLVNFMRREAGALGLEVKNISYSHLIPPLHVQAKTLL